LSRKGRILAKILAGWNIDKLNLIKTVPQGVHYIVTGGLRGNGA
jgi:hypothetical protein